MTPSCGHWRGELRVGLSVGVRTGGGAAGTSTVVGDHHGTPLLQVAQASNTVARSYTDPYGNARGVGLYGERCKSE